MLEICCGSYYDALQAASGGAGRIELNCALHMGGLTPSLASLELVKEHCNVKVIAMVRPRGGGFCYSEEDFDVMLRECEHLVRYGADGIAFGCLREDASIDRERNARMISIIHSHGKEAVFHRAFDCTSNPYESIETLIELGADRLLTSGLKPKAVEGKDTALRRAASGHHERGHLRGHGPEDGPAQRLHGLHPCRDGRAERLHP